MQQIDNVNEEQLQFPNVKKEFESEESKHAHQYMKELTNGH